MFKSHLNLFPYIAIKIQKWNDMNINLNWSQGSQTNFQVVNKKEPQQTKMAKGQLVIATLHMI